MGKSTSRIPAISSSGTSTGRVADTERAFRGSDPPGKSSVVMRPVLRTRPGMSAAGVLLPRRGRLEERRAAAARVPRDLGRTGAEHARAAHADPERARGRVLGAGKPGGYAVHAHQGRAEGARIAARREQGLPLGD